MKTQVIIVESQIAVRVDRYLRQNWSSLTQGIIESLLRRKIVTVNQKRVKSNHMVIAGDQIEFLSDVLKNYATKDQDKDKVKVTSSAVIILANKLLSEYLVMRTTQFIVINKPEGLAVQGGSKITLSIDDALAYLNQCNDVCYKLVHRLDKGTSGLLMIANGTENAAIIARAFKERIIKKTYYAVLSGILPQSVGTISGNFVKTKLAKQGMITTQPVEYAADDYEYSETHYLVMEQKNDKALVQFMPVTGRTHQLRVHSNMLGCAIVGDKRYGGQSHKRMLLHAKSLLIPAAVFGQEYAIDIPLPASFAADNE